MISVIIPIYNTSKYLPQCIDSVLTQSYKDLEVILVNDASTDNSLSICYAYQKKDSRIKILDKQVNEGVCKARFSGLNVADGEYVMWVDSDDWLEPDILGTMLYTIEDKNVDYVEVGFQRVFGKNKWIKKSGKPFVKGLIEQPKLFDDYFISFFGINLLAVNICGKLYRKSVVLKAGLSGTDLKMGEDLFFNMKLFPFLDRIYILDKIGYNYRFGGMTSHYNSHLFPNLKTIYMEKERLIEKYNYQKALNPMRVEFKNVFFSDVCQMIIFKNGSQNEIKVEIRKKLDDPIWISVLKITGKYSPDNDPFVKAISTKDVDTVYQICLEHVKHNLPNRLLKRALSFIASII